MCTIFGSKRKTALYGQWKQNAIESVFGFKQKISFVSTYSVWDVDFTLSITRWSRWITRSFTRYNRSAVEEKVNGCRVGEILWTWSWGQAISIPGRWYTVCMYNFRKRRKGETLATRWFIFRYLCCGLCSGWNSNVWEQHRHFWRK